MIKMERKRTEKSKNGSYNTPEVNAALKELFHGKCYIYRTGLTIIRTQHSHFAQSRAPQKRTVSWKMLYL